MKTLRYLLMVVATVSVLGAYAQGLAQEPQVQMTSTSGMVYSGSNLPQAAATGASLTGETPAAYSPGRIGHIRRAGEDEGFEDEGDDTVLPNEPYPLGDVFWPLALLACVYALMRVFLKRRAGERR